MESFFAVTAPGLSRITAKELVQLGLLPASSLEKAVEDGGVSFQGNLLALYQANLHLRTASRVVVRLGSFYAALFSELRKKAGRLAWEKYLSPGQPISLSVTCRKSRLYHSGAVAERIAAAIADRLGRPIEIAREDQPQEILPQMILVRLLNDQVTISIDSSGDLLHRRGYRLATAKAPLRETLAAAMLLVSGWDTRWPLLDPFCGSGTIAIEAALLASRRPPGCASIPPRQFSFMFWPGFDQRDWKNLLDSCMPESNNHLPVIQASDRDAGAIQIAQANAKRAGVQNMIEFSHRAVSAIEPPSKKGWMVTNPPYGKRVSGNKDIRNLYAQLGNVLRAKCPSWQVAILCSELSLLGQTRLPLDTSFSTINGGLSVRLGLGTVQ